MEELNKSGRKPFGIRVMIKVKKIGIKDESGNHREGSLIIPHDSWERRQTAEVVGQVVELGANAWYDRDDPPKIGDYVIFKRYAGIHIEGVDGEAYRNVMDTDVHTITINGDNVEVIDS